MKERKAFDFLLIFCLFISSKMIERVALELQIGEGRGHAVHHRPQNIQTHHHHYHHTILIATEIEALVESLFLEE